MSLPIFVQNGEQIVHTTFVDFVTRTITEPIHIMQYDNSIPILEVVLYKDGQSYLIPDYANVSIRWGKPDGTFVYNPAIGINNGKNTVYFEITTQMTTHYGDVEPIVEIEINNKIAGSGSVSVFIDRNPIQQSDIESSVEYKTAKEYAETSERYAKQCEEISEQFSGTLKSKGTYAFEDLPNLEDVEEGWMFNISNQFTTTNEFREGPGHVMPLGTNIYKTVDGVWDCLAGSSVNNWDTIDSQIIKFSNAAAIKRSIYRGQKLGTSVTADQYNEINAGTFKGMFLGDYWEIGGRIWRIVDFDYWLGCGDIPCTTHHLIIMPDHILYTAAMNDTNITTGAYVGSKMYTANLTEAKNIVNGAFTAAHILNHREYLQNATINGHAYGGSWFNSTVELPNEIMMYGSYIFTPNSEGIVHINRYTIDKTQLAGMNIYPKLINPHREAQRLRDVVTDNNFAQVAASGLADNYTASTLIGVRPVFGICKENS